MNANPRDSLSSDDLLDRQLRLVLETVASRKWRILAVGFTCAALGVALSFSRPVVFRAEATILPKSQPGMGSGLLGQFLDPTVLRSGTDALENVYRDIVTSDSLLDELLRMKWWPSNDSSDSLSLYQILDVENHNLLRANADVKRRLRRSILAFDTDKASGLMRLSCTLPHQPAIAAAIVNELLRSLDEFVLEHRTGAASRQQDFLEERLDSVAIELERATMSLTQFLETNRRYSESPELMRRYEELAREVEAQTTVWVELRRQLEISRIEANKTLPAIDVLDHAGVPIRKAGPSRVRFAFVGLLLGLFGSFGWHVTRSIRGAGVT